MQIFAAFAAVEPAYIGYKLYTFNSSDTKFSGTST
jgi:hypothetical protein